MEKDLESSLSPPNFSKDYWKLLPLLIPINWPSLVTSWVEVQKIYSKMYLVLCTDTHRDVTDSVNHGMVQNTKTWISWEQNVIFPWNKKILNLCLICCILRSYCCEAEVTFNTDTALTIRKKVRQQVFAVDICQSEGILTAKI